MLFFQVNYYVFRKHQDFCAWYPYERHEFHEHQVSFCLKPSDSLCSVFSGKFPQQPFSSNTYFSMFSLHFKLLSPSESSFIPASPRLLQLRSSSLRGDFAIAGPMYWQDSTVRLLSEILLNKKERQHLEKIYS